MSFGRPRHWLYCILFIGWLHAIAVVPAAAQSKTDSRRHNASLEQLARTYASLSHYFDTGNSSVVVNFEGVRHDLSYSDELAISRPDLVACDLGAMSYVTNGKESLTLLKRSKTYRLSEAPKNLTARVIFPTEPRTHPDDPVSTLSAQRMWLVLTLMFDREAVARIEHTCRAITKEPSRDSKGARLDGLLLDYAKGPDFRLWINSTTGLIQEIELVVPQEEWTTAQQENKETPQIPAQAVRIAWQGSATKEIPPGEDPFKIHIPRGYAPNQDEALVARRSFWTIELFKDNASLEFEPLLADPAGEEGYLNMLVKLIHRWFGHGGKAK